MITSEFAHSVYKDERSRLDCMLKALVDPALEPQYLSALSRAAMDRKAAEAEFNANVIPSITKENAAAEMPAVAAFQESQRLRRDASISYASHGELIRSAIFLTTARREHIDKQIKLYESMNSNDGKDKNVD